ncbi:hypothetical protein K474DRAFT_1687327 [Panus rudis PR-1116 ss-1]|nr:hypothetical protein K474DRAFT_1687327 [Panus rudis PR-1116 ss-1]
MYTFVTVLAAFSALVATVSAKNVVVTVGHNTTDNATTVFDPAQVFAKLNDIVVFNFTEGNHTVTQSTFAAPCVPAHDTDPTINGFDSSFRVTANGTAGTILTVPITPDLANKTIWFFDFNTCAQGGVGGININDSSTETLDGFVRNAIRLNGTDANSDSNTSSASSSRASSSSRPTATGTSSDTSDASSILQQQITFGFATAFIFVFAALAF